MKNNTFAYHLTKFFTNYMITILNASSNTVSSYSDTFRLLMMFYRDKYSIKANDIELIDLTKDRIEAFLKDLELTRNSSITTRNIRLAAIKSFVKYLQYECPIHLSEWQKILKIPSKKTESPIPVYLTLDGIKLLLSVIDQNTKFGLRDLAILSLMYDSGARVQEIIDSTASSIRFINPPTIKLVGKGNKARIVPLMGNQVDILKKHMEENKLLNSYASEYPLFVNKYGSKFSRVGISDILDKHLKKARAIDDSGLIPDGVTNHALRHSKAVHLLQAGVGLLEIRDFLGHEYVTTTQIYARIDSKQKKEALEKAYSDVVDVEESKWKSKDTLEWLKEFQKTIK